MPKVHMVASESPLRFREGELQTGLCGELVPDAKPIFTLNLASCEIEGASTISFCKECLALALSPVTRRSFIYGIAEAQIAHDLED